MEEDKEFQIKILTEIMKKQQELINNIFNIVEKDYIKKSKFEEDETVIEEMAEHIVSSAIVDDTVCSIKCDYETDILEDCTHEKMLNCTKEYFRNKVKENKE